MKILIFSLSRFFSQLLFFIECHGIEFAMDVGYPASRSGVFFVVGFFIWIEVDEVCLCSTLVSWAVAGVMTYFFTFKASIVALWSCIGYVCSSSSSVLVSPVVSKACPVPSPWPRPGSPYVHGDWAIVVCWWGIQ
jgi:hypothetical protein